MVKNGVRARYRASTLTVQVNRAQRRILHRSICVCSTVSGVATNILPGTPPIDLLARERKVVFDHRRSGRQDATQFRNLTMSRWKERNEELITGA